MIKVVLFHNEKKYINDFLQLPKKLYSSEELMEDYTVTKSILLGTHVLNQYFSLYKFIAYLDNKTVGRCIVTAYPNDDIAYLGFYECIHNSNVAKELLSFVENYCKENGFHKIIGPVDTSFWMKYRMKVNMFQKRPYTSEPYNKEYYFNQWKENGFEVKERYVSNSYPIIVSDFKDDRIEKAYQKYIGKGFQIVKPDIKDFSKLIHEVYLLIMELYQDFPIFKNITEEDFTKMFEPFKRVVNMDLIRMVYYQEKPVAFCISIPNYHNLTNNVTFLKIVKILKMRKHPKEYVVLYLGVLPEYFGMGNAIMKEIVEELKKSKASCIGALIREGKYTNNYVRELKKEKYEYVLLEKRI